MHGDLVFENEVLDKLLSCGTSCMAVSSTLPLPEKDFKAVIADGKIQKVGVEFFDNAVAAQALYCLKQQDWQKWLNRIVSFCEAGNRKVYAENALNDLNGEAGIEPLAVKDLLCAEVDDPADLEKVSKQLKAVKNRTVYLCFATDIIHGGHITIIRKAARLGKLIIGVLSDEAVASYKRFPLVPQTERMKLFENIAGVWRVVGQDTLSYKANLEKYKPDVVVHGDDWCTGFQQPVREEVPVSYAHLTLPTKSLV